MTTIILILLASCVPFLTAQDCNNPLLDTFGLTGLSAPVSGANLPYCGNLQADQTCCSDATVTSFQDRLNTLSTNLQDAAAARDQYIVNLRNQFAQQFSTSAGALALLADQITNLQTANATIGNEVASQRDQIQTISTSLTDVDNNFRTILQDYQNARVGCFDTVLKVQASAWCLACDPNYEALGVQSNGSIAFSPNLCTTISQACFPFLAAAERENPLYRARQSLQRLQNLLAYVANFTAAGAIPATVLRGDIFRSNNDTERTVTIPPGCVDASNCSWLCDNLFSNNGVLNQAIVANGAGLLGGADIDFGPIGQSAANSRRMLQSTVATWNPDIQATRMTVTAVTADPANLASTVGDGATIVVVPVSGMRLGVGSAMAGLLAFMGYIMLLQ